MKVYFMLYKMRFIAQTILNSENLQMGYTVDRAAHTESFDFFLGMVQSTSCTFL